MKKFVKEVGKEIAEEEQRKRADALRLIELREAKVHIEAEEKIIRERRGW